MSMQAPATDLDLEQVEARHQMLIREHTIGVVNPSGVVQEVVCAPDGSGVNSLPAGRDIVRLIEGEIRLTAYARDAGWTLLEQRCIDDGCPEIYQTWRETILARMDGHHIELPLAPESTKDRIVYDLSSIYPPSVIDQRKNGKVGVTPKRFIPGKGLVDADAIPESVEDKKRRVGRRARELGLAPKEE